MLAQHTIKLLLRNKLPRIFLLAYCREKSNTVGGFASVLEKYAWRIQKIQNDLGSGKYGCGQGPIEKFNANEAPDGHHADVKLDKKGVFGLAGPSLSSNDASDGNLSFPAFSLTRQDFPSLVDPRIEIFILKTLF